MNIGAVLKGMEKFAISNSPAILTGIGVAGAVTASYLTGKATIKAWDILLVEEAAAGRPLTAKENVELAWKFYIPPALVLVGTTASIIGANRIGASRLVAMTTAYSITERAYTEYKEKVVQNFGAKKDQEVVDHIARDNVANNPPSGNTIIVTGTGDTLCYDKYSLRYFRSDMETIRKAMNDVNAEALHDDFCSLATFYDRINLDYHTQHESIGWSSDKLGEIQFTAVVTDDGKTALVLDFIVTPRDRPRYF